MSGGRLLVAAVLALGPAAITGSAAASTSPSADSGAGPVTVVMDRARAAGTLGGYLTVRSTLTNAAGGPTGPLTAHLDVVSVRNAVYVDPEDWSADRTVTVESLSAGGRSTLSWAVHNVNEGEFDLYVVLLPAGSAPGAGPLTASPPMRLTVTGRQTLPRGNVLGVAVVVPVALGLLTATDRLRGRRRLGR